MYHQYHVHMLGIRAIWDMPNTQAQQHEENIVFTQTGRKCATQTWNKSIEICSLSDGKVVQVTEHPQTLDDAKANVAYIQEKLSQEAFIGENVRLLNAKNILLVDAEGTRGTCVYTHKFHAIKVKVNINVSLFSLSSCTTTSLSLLSLLSHFSLHVYTVQL